MRSLKQYLYISAGLLALASCKPEIQTAPVTKGSADFTRYIAVGNSLTAGFADGGLYLEGQMNSYPSIIAKQMQQAGGGEFTQPLFNADQSNGSGYLKLSGFTATGTPITTQVNTNLAVRGQATIPGFGNVILYTKYAGEINNYGVPGIKLQQITYAPYGNLNGYFERLLPGNAGTNNTTYLDFVTAKPFTFFTNWLGNNDALGYATAGGASDALTDKDQFSGLYNLTIAKLTASGAKGAVATIPDVTSIPYFNTVTIDAILAAVKAANPSVTTLYVNARQTATPPAASYQARPATAADLVVLTFDTKKIGQPVSTPFGNLPYGLTQFTPIENQYVLDANEATLVKDYVTSYNTTIKAAAAAKGLAVFDAYTFLNNLKANGMIVDGVNVNSNYISGGIFSLDGVHLTPRGYAIVANEFIKAINKQYGSTIPLASVSAYNGVKFP
ncbi:G-D-S-L family lipolytic protein [Mucilaginibacter terrenus]|uniref:G-D-S-L family lipolytic protein n=1 Tax=Mucilaginibacter terrenus TaxID=2482727 RepID=A0A3E2NMM8_9SPHI|nr:SGNH/GDSL hydrolase family protein [Mucilaginibacter terrenus]RFZ82257.1 G-D-S-L family lipolytic protein [Mucilaginibacter terrenus]